MQHKKFLCHLAKLPLVGRGDRKENLKNNADCDSQSRVDVPVAFNRVVVDLGQAVPRPHHNLVQFWVP